MNVITFAKLRDLCIEFSNKTQRGYKKDTVKNLFIKKAKNKKDYDEYSFVNILRMYVQGNEQAIIDSDTYEDAVRQTVKSYSSSKETAIELMKRFTSFVEKSTGIKYTLTYPPIPVNSTFERLMYISKYLHDPDAKISELEDILWISGRTIEEDIRKLRGNDDDPIQICGKKYIIKDMTRENDHVRDMASTPHPFFLTCNLTEVIVMLKGLKEMSKNPDLRPYAMKVAGEIWEQLSVRAKNRIEFVMKELMPDDINWFGNLEKVGDEDTFWPEYICSSYGTNCILECLKNNLSCYIEYRENDKTKVIKVDKVIKYYEKEILVLINGKEKLLILENILQSAKTPEELADEAGLH